ncbi:uncharacterized protein LOC113216350 [Frankliniella occidentalis]|uniref:Uncharacterized protein LOC113216350 n=1 Tax=Frankliniella occidentalis TaxID=133901 RepID=A0A6J1TJM2_FRAOC|nr:uncharacterized protein LOC113216350 [Frankliniella occidentalis]
MSSLIKDWDEVFDGSQRSDEENTTVGEVTRVAAPPRKGTSPRKNVKELSPQKSGGSSDVQGKTPQKERDEAMGLSGETASMTPRKTPRKTPQKAKDVPKKLSLSESPKNGSQNDARKKKSPQKKAVENSTEMAKATRAGTPRKIPEGDLRKPGASPLLGTAASSRVSPRKRDRTAAFGSAHTIHKRSRQTDMSTFVSSFSERELDRELRDIDTEIEAAENQLCTSPSDSLQSMSPSMSETSDGVFKTPQDKGAYRALTFGSCSPSISSGLRQLQSMMAENLRRVEHVENSMHQHAKTMETIVQTMRKILSCVLPPLESNIAEDIPKLPLTDKDGEKSLNTMMSDKEEFNKVVTFLYGLVGTSPKDAVYAIMKTLFTDEFASTKSMKGIHRSGKPRKDAFMGTSLLKAVMCAVRRRFKDSTVKEVMELTGNWLKDAPSREKKRLRRRESRERRDREYDEEGSDTTVGQNDD